MSGYYDIPIFITCRDRVEDLRTLVTWLVGAGQQRIILLDNASTYEPLLEYFEYSPHEVRRLGQNYGSRALWRTNAVPHEPFVLTDPDIIPTEDCPLDAVGYLAELVDRHRRPKAALGLYLEDTPEFNSKPWERQLVSVDAELDGGPKVTELEPGVFATLSDTTFAVWMADARYTLSAVRCGPPSLYMARHTSWYRLETGPTEEERYYLDRAIKGPTGSSWAEGTQV